MNLATATTAHQIDLTDEFGAILPAPAWVTDAARLQVAGHARDAAEARVLLDICGLLGEP